MGLKIATPHQTNVRLIAAAVLAAGLLTIIPLSLTTIGREGSSPATTPVQGRSIAFVEFGSTADTVWRAVAADPSRRDKLLAIEHAHDFGIVAALAPAGDRFAYTALATTTKAPSPDTPAALWLADLRGDTAPRRLAAAVDLLVRPVWSPDGTRLVFRRSSAAAEAADKSSRGFPASAVSSTARPESPAYAVLDSIRLVSLEIETGSEWDLVVSTGVAVFPVAFAPKSDKLYFVRVGIESSELDVVDLASLEVRRVGALADGLTRDWTLSPAGKHLAYLEMSAVEGRFVSQAFIFDIESGTRLAVGGLTGDDFGPVWSSAGDLAWGRAGSLESGAGIRTLQDGWPATISGSRAGFDVPLSWSPTDDALAVRSFDGSSAMAPGRPALAIIWPDGRRTVVALGDLTFLGWTAER